MIPEKEYSAEGGFVKKKETVTKKGYNEELIELKALLDSGVITQEEFDAKKKQLLGL
jgi:predicted Zn-dependent peptidase